MKKTKKTIEAKNNFLPQKQAKILGVKVDRTSLPQLLAKITQKIESGTKFSIVTPNPEIILAAQTDSKFLSILNAADLAIPDGVGLRLAIPDLNIIHGRKLMVELLALAKQKKWQTFMLGRTNGPQLDQNANPILERDIKIESEVIDKISKIQPELLFVGFGAPRQEKWISRNLPRLKANCIMAVGGALDYLDGSVPLPPEWMEKMELEWLWRLFTQPRRPRHLIRILRAVIVFPIMLLFKSGKLRIGNS